MNNKQKELTYIGFNLNPERDKKIINFLKKIDRGARGFVIRKILEYHIEHLSEEEITLILTGKGHLINKVNENNTTKNINNKRENIENNSENNTKNDTYNKINNINKPKKENKIVDETKEFKEIKSNFVLPEELKGLADMFG